MTYYRITMEMPTEPTASAIVYTALVGDPSTKPGAKVDPDDVGPQLVRVVPPNGEVWYGELDVDLDAKRPSSRIDWGNGFTEYSSPTDLFAAPVHVGRTVRILSLVNEGDCHEFKITRIDRL